MDLAQCRVAVEVVLFARAAVALDAIWTARGGFGLAARLGLALRREEVKLFSSGPADSTNSPGGFVSTGAGRNLQQERGRAPAARGATTAAQKAHAQKFKQTHMGLAAMQLFGMLMVTPNLLYELFNIAPGDFTCAALEKVSTACYVAGKGSLVWFLLAKLAITGMDSRSHGAGASQQPFWQRALQVVNRFFLYVYYPLSVVAVSILAGGEVNEEGTACLGAALEQSEEAEKARIGSVMAAMSVQVLQQASLLLLFVQPLLGHSAPRGHAADPRAKPSASALMYRKVVIRNSLCTLGMVATTIVFFGANIAVIKRVQSEDLWEVSGIIQAFDVFLILLITEVTIQLGFSSFATDIGVPLCGLFRGAGSAAAAAASGMGPGHNHGRVQPQPENSGEGTADNSNMLPGTTGAPEKIPLNGMQKEAADPPQTGASMVVSSVKTVDRGEP